MQTVFHSLRRAASSAFLPCTHSLLNARARPTSVTRAANTLEPLEQDLSKILIYQEPGEMTSFIPPLSFIFSEQGHLLISEKNGEAVVSTA